jgi:hypothetical protein
MHYRSAYNSCLSEARVSSGALESVYRFPKMYDIDQRATLMAVRIRAIQCDMVANFAIKAARSQHRC